MVLSLKLGEENIVLTVPNPIYIYKLGEKVTLNIMRVETEDKFEIVKTVVTNVEHLVLDFSEGEQVVKVQLEKINDIVQEPKSN
jgi:hypothetical protein